MKHTRSLAEIEIRQKVVARFRELWPDARIIHEMNVEGGAARADVVAVQPDRVWICEIKSERDTLSRLPDQVKFFGPSCHGLIIAAHAKWTTSPGMSEPHPKHGYRTTIPSKIDDSLTGVSRRLYDLWTYPEPVLTSGRHWSAPFSAQVPWYHRMIHLLWSDEIRAVAGEHRIACTSKTSGSKLAKDLSQLMNGREIERAVCKQLRARTFAEADEPIFVDRKIVPPHPNSVRQESIL
ncbi:hypothetical protein [Mesorhizobium sp. M7A.F.Ca.MR.148.00.0.0]|uniref:hypothetical protein n=1 Tax=Mesorhizobium sp. M7A.F.Ca.MR.148.00.0.0 TaxID=2496775 RepID=UPI000FCC1D0E|nr:hypothetical protein [Mesorhizobium sp. M7A.F.Ca.MR.148.00.0.0]RUV37447.1 hypothetical protein EOB49_11855 [Mesorhizobium sp. M7A.F.Ca.MR.148.00.0.0]